jgi:hypothetical protein
MNTPLLALTLGVALLLATSHLTAPIRAEIVRPWWLSLGVGCVQCVSFWTALAVSYAARWDGGGGLFDWSALHQLPADARPVLDALAASGVCSVLGRLGASRTGRA